jgi:hypothetical protein
MTNTKSIKPEWVVKAEEEKEGSLDSWADEEERSGNGTNEGVYLGDGVYA